MNQRPSTAYDFRVRRAETSLRRSVTESIRRAIAVERFKPGERMPERDLCEMTGVSRTLVREALRQLESEGVVTVETHKGPTVATISADQAIGVYQVREVLEGLAVRLFAENATDDDLAALEGSLRLVRNAYETGDVLDRLEAKNYFYHCLIAGAGNEALGAALYTINARTMLLRGRSLQVPARWKASLTELENLIAALRDRDAERAYDLAVHHVRMAAAGAMKSFENEGAL